MQDLGGYKLSLVGGGGGGGVFCFVFVIVGFKKNFF